LVASTKELTLIFPSKSTLGNLYLSKRTFPHNRSWIGQASGEVKLSLPEQSIIGLAMAHDVDARSAEASATALGQITSMDLSTSQYSPAFLAAILKLSRLVELRLDFLNLTSQDFVNLNEATALETLWLTGSSINDQILPLVQGVKTLTSLTIKSTKISDASMKALAALPLLKNLHLPASISDNGVADLSASSSLEDLDLSYTTITAKALASLSNLKSLSTLYVNDTTLSDDSMAEVKNIKGLKVLFLNGTKVTDKCLEQLAEAAQLEHLELRDTKVTEIGIARLRSKLKDCAIFGP
jgi:Leucine-rich repeat (LRR) protein